MEPVTLLAEAVGTDKRLSCLQRDCADGLDDCRLAERDSIPVWEQWQASVR